MATKNSLFLGTFIHSKGLDVLEYLHNTALFVNEKGTIVHIEPDCGQEKAEKTIFPTLGWTIGEINITIAKEGQFFFPGFIGLYSHLKSDESIELTETRHAHPRLPIPQRWYLRKIHPLGLAQHLHLPHGSLALLSPQSAKSLLPRHPTHTLQRHNHRILLCHHFRPLHQPPR